MPEHHDDVELGELEDDAFIPHNTTKQFQQHSFLTSWMPPRLRNIYENLSRIKLTLLILTIFIILMLFLGWIGNLPVSVTLSSKHSILSAELAQSLNGSAIPSYVLTFAPLVFLDRSDIYFPSDLGAHLANTHPTINFTHVEGAPSQLTLQNLDLLNNLGGKEIYLASNENVMKLPKYLNGKAPDSKTLQTKDATSCVIITVDKGSGIIDAFYMYFYSFNEGPTVMGHGIGNHLGDWEHNMVRFVNGVPTAVWYSQHNYGAAYTYDSVQKVDKRPIAFSAKGSHANYAKSGKHDLAEGEESIPKSIVFDHTSEGTLWDPTLSAYYYTYLPEKVKMTPAKEEYPVNYLYFKGMWGDAEYGDEVKGQESFHNFHKWTGGPRGPLDKFLDRKDVCLPNRPKCVVKTEI